MASQKVLSIDEACELVKDLLSSKLKKRLFATKPILVCITDLDGTVLDESVDRYETEVIDPQLGALQKMRRVVDYFGFATGRSLRDARQTLRKSLTIDFDIEIGTNGSEIECRYFPEIVPPVATDKRKYSRHSTEDLSNRLSAIVAEFARRYGLSVSYESRAGLDLFIEEKEGIGWTVDTKKLTFEKRQNLKGLLEEEKNQWENEQKSLWEKSATPTVSFSAYDTSGDSVLEYSAIPPEHNKAIAILAVLSKIARKHEKSGREVIVVYAGNGSNDVPVHELNETEIVDRYHPTGVPGEVTEVAEMYAALLYSYDPLARVIASFPKYPRYWSNDPGLRAGDDFGHTTANYSETSSQVVKESMREFFKRNGMALVTIDVAKDSVSEKESSADFVVSYSNLPKVLEAVALKASSLFYQAGYIASQKPRVARFIRYLPTMPDQTQSPQKI